MNLTAVNRGNADANGFCKACKNVRHDYQDDATVENRRFKEIFQDDAPQINPMIVEEIDSHDPGLVDILISE